MPGQEDLIRIMDATLEKSQIKDVISALQPLKEEIKAFSGISIFTKSTAGAAEFRAQAEQLQAALDKIKVLETQMEALRAKNHVANKSRTDQEIADTQRKAQATRGRVADIRSEEDAYKKLTNEVTKHMQALKIAAAQYGVNSKEAKQATAALKPFQDQLNNINKVAGDSRSQVGKYAEGIKEFAGQFLGLLAPIYLAQKAFAFLSDSVKEFMKAQDSTARLKNVLGNLGHAGDFEQLDKAAEHLAISLGTVAKKDISETFQKLYLYGKLSKNQILELTPVIADFAAKQRIDLPEATDAITKALEGNARSLKTYGINMKDGKDSTERFGIIMSQLKPKVEGAAAAFGDELAGSIKKTDIAIEELKVHIGEELAPTLAKSERFLLAFIDRIPQWFDAADEAIGRLKAKIASFFGFDGLQKEFDEYDMLKKQKKEYADQLERIASLRENFAKKAKSDQDKEIAYLEKAFKLEYDRVQLLLKKGDIAGAQAPAEAASEIKLELDAYKEYQNSNGAVDPNAKLQSAEQLKKLKEELAKRKAARLEAAIEYQKILADEKDNTIASRMAAFKKIEELEAQQILSEEDRAKNRVDQIGRLAAIRFAALNDNKIMAAENAKELEGIEAAHQKAMEDIRASALERRKNYINEVRNYELAAHKTDFVSGKITKEQYDKANDKTNNQADHAVLTVQLQDLQSQAALVSPDSDPGVKLARQISEIKKDIINNEANAELTTAEALARAKKKVKEDEIEIAKQGEKDIEAFVIGGYERQINRLQKQIDQNNVLKETETRNIAQSTLSLQEKAAAQILLDAKVNANNEAIHRNQQNLKIKEAKFERDAALASVIWHTAQTVMKDTANVPWPASLAVAALDIVLGAAQAASILAKPIPTYAKGTDHKPESGPMIVGEKGPEMVVDPSGNVSMTPGVPTLAYGQRGIKIIPADEVKHGSFSRILSRNIQPRAPEERNNKTEEILIAILEVNQMQISAMKKKQEIHNHVYIDTKFQQHLKDAL